MLIFYLFIGLLCCGVVLWICLFYPKQQANPDAIQPIVVTTPEKEKYHNDVLHPCIRCMQDGRYVMVQSPWYNSQDGIENPILYISDNPMRWENGIIVVDTPETGYNSDPNVYVEGDRIYVFWREFDTPLCKQLQVICAVVGVWTDDEGESFSQKQVYMTRNCKGLSIEICPILMKKGDTYRFYATWYQTKEEDRRNLGIAIWEGTSLENPDFQLTKKVSFKTKYICDKYKKLKLFGHIFFIPVPHKFDLWHFDLMEHNNKLYMIMSEEMGDVIMMAKSDDWEHFSLIRKPLINAHYMENHVGYLQRYYKPTAYVQDSGELHIFYTTNPSSRNQAHKLYMINKQI